VTPLFVPRHIAELAPRGISCLIRFHTRFEVSLFALRQVKRQLIFEVAIQLPPFEEPLQAQPRFVTHSENMATS
jgi:uncharacterized protein YbgA (DUF1722 family)